VTEGNAASVVSWFNNPEASVSAHYMVRKDGVVEQFVHESDTAWHAGRVDHPTADLVIERLPANPNGYSIGIEHEGNGKEELTDAQRKASIDLIQDICMRRDIPQNRRHIVGHHEIYSKKTCPGAIDVDRLVRELCAAGVKA
jgi:N-acetylmuramoyl-L-alanine amidase